jgi:hypothetical protein
MSGRWLHENQIGRNMGPSGSSFHAGACQETRLEELAHRAEGPLRRYLHERQDRFIDEMERDDAWLKAHIEEIVDQHTHKVIAILDQGIVEVGKSVVEVQRLVTEKYPDRVPLVFEVPSREEFACLLWNTNTQL